MLSPKEVFSALAADFRKRNLSYTEVAKLTGYKMQTIANIISSRKEYLSVGQATRFCLAFGYNKEFLTSGKGRLNHDDDIIESLKGGAFGEDSKKLNVVLSMLSRYLYIVDDPALSVLYRNVLNLINEKDGKKAYEYIKNQEKIFDMLAKEHGVNFPEDQE